MCEEVSIEEVSFRLQECGMKEPDGVKVCTIHFNDPLHIKINCFRDRLIWEINENDEESSLQHYLRIRYNNSILTTEFYCRKTRKTLYHYSFEDMIKHLHENYPELFNMIKEPSD